MMRRNANKLKMPSKYAEMTSEEMEYDGQLYVKCASYLITSGVLGLCSVITGGASWIARIVENNANSSSVKKTSAIICDICAPISVICGIGAIRYGIGGIGLGRDPLIAFNNTITEEMKSLKALPADVIKD